ncbi:MAG TPA: cytochrome c biogenesis protein [Bacteroidia bacterium]|nr:cytochrome c biogenesis protein CcsA [Bacteroidota bacterium]MBP9922284.1 cytochrome c biogenesis protein CcsA [Bacteroidia bacterium]MBK7429805.1 cytochrome c biogenesis protein CcsA [Bacteroidota bacterium]MBK7572141.1 cytochrome c biogenesis protein CcsA [Bacteroidota bacterium]MBK8584070.1 cytochrome c biogenesis protein CcsA [Bacteroidota bacterium]
MNDKKINLLSGLQWWKWLCILLLFYTFYQGLMIEVPRLAILHETIRNLFFHVTMWFSMIIMMLASLIYGIRYLSTNDITFDTKASEAAYTGVFLGLLGLATGSLWAKFTWGAWWVNDAKLNGAAAAMLVYFAYIILRGSIDDEHKKAKLAAVYGIFAFTMMLVFIMILPRLTDSLHPGNGGNPGFGNYDLDKKMRTVFYPAVIGWALLATWITEINVRIKTLRNKIEDEK